MRILKSFQYALRGIKYCITNERNMRIHSIVAIYVLIFSYFFEFSQSQLIMLILTILSVISAEMVNTAIEGLSDIFVSEYNVAARNIKDVAAGAVFVSAVGAVIIGLILFSDISAYFRIFNFFYLYPISFVALGIFTILSIFYIFYGPYETISRVKKIVKRDKKI